MSYTYDSMFLWVRHFSSVHDYIDCFRDFLDFENYENVKKKTKQKTAADFPAPICATSDLMSTYFVRQFQNLKESKFYDMSDQNCFR